MGWSEINTWSRTKSKGWCSPASPNNVYTDLSKCCCFSQARKLCDLSGAFQLKIKRKCMFQTSNWLSGPEQIFLILRRSGFFPGSLRKGVKFSMKCCFSFQLCRMHNYWWRREPKQNHISQKRIYILHYPTVRESHGAIMEYQNHIALKSLTFTTSMLHKFEDPHFWC